MKTFHLKITLFVLFFTVLFSFSACEIFEAIGIDDECESSKLAKSEDRTFVLGVRVKLADGTPVDGATVKMTYKKIYCTGETKGLKELVFNNLTDDSGYAFSGWQQTYTYGNEKDRVVIKIEVSFNEAPSLGKAEFEYTYYWIDMDEEFDEHYGGFVNLTYDLTI